jgi:hypothetical protein
MRRTLCLSQVVCGDFYQLPPIVTKIEQVLWSKLVPANLSRNQATLHVPGKSNKRKRECAGCSVPGCENCQLELHVLSRGFTFQSEWWWDAGFVTVLLSRVYRQADKETVRRLGRVRTGQADEADLAWFNERCSAPPQLMGGASRPLLLAPLNKVVDARNDQEMQVLRARGAEPSQFLSSDFVEVNEKGARLFEAADAERMLRGNTDFYEQCLAHQLVRLSEGARVLLLVNLECASAHQTPCLSPCSVLRPACSFSLPRSECDSTPPKGE